jgi:hypothetical protein
MRAPAEAHGLDQQVLDFLFARLGGNTNLEPPAAAPTLAHTPASAPTRAEAPAKPTPPPEVRSPEDFRAGAEWLQRERQRLEAYTRAQLARIQEERQALAKQQSLNEQTLVLRAQEVTRKEELVLTQGRAVQQQSEDLTQREQALAAQLHQWWQTNQQLVALEEASHTAREDAARHQALLDALRTETAALHQARENTRAELREMLSGIEELRRTREREEAGLEARRQQLLRRLDEADRSALAAERRQAELDDLEALLRRECDEQERELRLRRQELDAAEQRLRGERDEQLALRRQIEFRLGQVERAEAALQRRQLELNERAAAADLQARRRGSERDERGRQWSARPQ